MAAAFPTWPLIPTEASEDATPWDRAHVHGGSDGLFLLVRPTPGGRARLAVTAPVPFLAARADRDDLVPRRVCQTAVSYKDTMFNHPSEKTMNVVDTSGWRPTTPGDPGGWVHMADRPHDGHINEALIPTDARLQHHRLMRLIQAAGLSNAGYDGTAAQQKSTTHAWYETAHAPVRWDWRAVATGAVAMGRAREVVGAWRAGEAPALLVEAAAAAVARWRGAPVAPSEEHHAIDPLASSWMVLAALVARAPQMTTRVVRLLTNVATNDPLDEWPTRVRTSYERALLTLSMAPRPEPLEGALRTHGTPSRERRM